MPTPPLAPTGLAIFLLSCSAAAASAMAPAPASASGRPRHLRADADADRPPDATPRRRLQRPDHVPPSRAPYESVGLSPSDVPQFVLLTFDDSVNPHAVGLYSPLSTVRDSRGCGIKATWYVSIAGAPGATPLTKCEYVSALRRGQHEIATHTYGHTGLPGSDEIMGAVDFLSDECGVPREEMRGFRAPYLKFDQSTLDALSAEGFLYDSSIGDVGSGSDRGRGSTWPYTMDGGVAVDCATTSGSCDPSAANPGLWEVPMWTLYDESDRGMVLMDWPGDAFAHLNRNFHRKYDGNRAPLGIYLHAAWLQLHGADLKRWAEEVLSLHDNVYFVTNYEMIEWMRDPVPSSAYASRRDCVGQVSDCLPPPASAGGCGHGSFDPDLCACRCDPPYAGTNCLGVGSYPAPAPAPAASAPTPPPPTPAPIPPPTPEPTSPPADGPAPSPSPARTPSAGPVPATGPTDPPTGVPTPGPTGAPTEGPAPGPTGMPTEEPTLGPTPADPPAEGPAPGPTGAPAAGPTSPGPAGAASRAPGAPPATPVPSLAPSDGAPAPAPAADAGEAGAGTTAPGGGAPASPSPGPSPSPPPPPASGSDLDAIDDAGGETTSTSGGGVVGSDPDAHEDADGPSSGVDVGAARPTPRRILLGGLALLSLSLWA